MNCFSNYSKQSWGVQPSLRGLWSRECRAAAAAPSNLSQSARATARAFICSSEKIPKGISDVGTCCQPPRFIFYSRLEWNCHLGLRSFLLNSDWKFFQMKVIKVQDSEFLKRHNSFLVIPRRVLARLSHLEIKCCASTVCLELGVGVSGSNTRYQSQ